jgi:hypothetical protein
LNYINAKFSVDMAKDDPRLPIRAKDLRIGNVVGEVGTLRMFKVRGTSDGAVLVSSEDGGERWLAENQLIAVALRAELLVWLGFSFSEPDRTHTLELPEGIIKVVDCRDVFLGGHGSLSEGLRFQCTITSMHQFQNLYFSLTGMEASRF